MKTRINWIVFLLVFAASTLLQASNIINIQIRFYQGFNEKQKVTDSDRSFFLTDNNQQVLSYQEIAKEKSSIKGIYNLKEIKNITNLFFEFTDNKKSQRKDLYFKKKDIKISLLKNRNNINKFELKIYKGINNTNTLMKTELILPTEKTTVIGFSDKKENLYFFSLYRKDKTRAKKQSKHFLPEIINEYIPQYPKEALNIEKKGDVILEGEISKKGRIQNIQIWKGDPLLNETALMAFRKWKFAPYKVSSPDKLTKIVLILIFEITKKSNMNKNYKNKLKEIKNTDLWKKIKNSKNKDGKSKPWILKICIVQGKKIKI